MSRTEKINNHWSHQ